MKTVCIISDTHGSMHPKVLACLHGCDHIIHAGDICDSSILTELKELAPVTAVLGNMDDSTPIQGLRRKASIEIEGAIFTVAHKPEQLNQNLRDVNALYSHNDKVPSKVIGIHGHTHVPKIATGIDAKPADLIVCPGSVTLPREGWMQTYAKIVVDNGNILSCEILDLKDEVQINLADL